MSQATIDVNCEYIGTEQQARKGNNIAYSMGEFRILPRGCRNFKYKVGSECKKRPGGGQIC